MGAHATKQHVYLLQIHVSPINAALAALAFAACGSDNANSQPAAAPKAPTEMEAVKTAADQPVKPAAGGKKIKTGQARFGRILQDNRGRSLYLFTMGGRRSPSVTAIAPERRRRF